MPARRTAPISLLLAGLAGAAAAAPAPRQEPPPAQEEVPLVLRVNHAIALGVRYLKLRQAPDGTFPGWEGDHPGGVTALAAYTLVKSGVRRSDPALSKALTAALASEPRSTYSASVALLLYEALGSGWTEHAERELAFLLDAQTSEGVWDYPGRHLCASNTQFALLALRAAHRMGLEVPEEALLACAKGIWRWQSRDGGFRYEDGAAYPTAGITAATLGGLEVIEQLAGSMGRVQGELRKRRREREQAQEWLAARFHVERNAVGSGAWTPQWHLSYLWALERYCGLAGRESFAGRDWYAEGARWLVDNQAHDGSWGRLDKLVVDTCFALLFLRRATVSSDGELAEIYAEIDKQAARREPPPPGPGAGALRLTDWWVAGPWQGKKGESLLADLPFDPAKAEPDERARLARRAWERVELKASDWTNLEELTSRGGDHQLWCLATHLVHAPPGGSEEPAEAVLWLELEDGWEVWVDGERVSHSRRVQAPIEPDVRVPLRLAPGVHRVVVVCEDDVGSAAFGARLGAPDGGAPPEGLSAVAEPPRRKR